MGSVPIIGKSQSLVHLWHMARKLRVKYPGAIYHVMNRGDRREPKFKDDVDRQRFLETLDEVCLRTGWGVRAKLLRTDQALGEFAWSSLRDYPNLV